MNFLEIIGALVLVGYAGGLGALIGTGIRRFIDRSRKEPRP